MSRRRNSGGGMVLRWQRALLMCREVPDDNPSGQAVIAIAAVLVSHADPDGRHCRPAIDTIAWQARASKRTVQLALAWMVDNGWLGVTKKVSRRPTEYRLLISVGAEEHLPAELPKVPTSTYQGNSVGAVVGAVVGADGHQDLRTSEAKSGGGGGGGAPLPPLGAAVAVRQIDVPDAVRDLAREVAVAAKVGIDAAVLAAPAVGALDRTGWDYRVLAVHCVESMNAYGPSRIINPSAFLATDLASVNAHMVPSPLMTLAGLLAELDAAEQARETPPGATRPDSDTGPMALYARHLGQAGITLVRDPQWWEVEAEHVAAYTDLARRVLDDWQKSQAKKTQAGPEQFTAPDTERKSS